MNNDIKYFLDNLKSGKEEKLEANSHILIVDSLNTFIRSFSVINHINPSGNHIGGLTGFLKSIGFIVRLIKPTKVILVFDGQGGSTNKRYLYPEYKANRDIVKVKNWNFDTREEETEAMTNQMVRLIDYLLCLPVHLLSIDKIEADDVIGHLVKKAPNKVTIMSADKDFLQLVSDKVTVYSPTKKKFYTPKEVLNEYGVLAENFIYYKVLLGDKGDNVPGVKGLGEKKLFKLFPSLNSASYDLNHIKLMASTHRKENPLYEKIHNYEKQLEINYKLMDLSNPNIPEEELDIIENTINLPAVNMDRNRFLSLYKEDLLGNSIPKVEFWIEDIFRYLTAYK